MMFKFDKEEEPVHVILAGISSRHADDAESIKRNQEILLKKVPELRAEDLAHVLSGKEGKCEYKLTK